MVCKKKKRGRGERKRISLTLRERMDDFRAHFEGKNIDGFDSK